MGKSVSYLDASCDVDALRLRQSGLPRERDCSPSLNQTPVGEITVEQVRRTFLGYSVSAVVGLERGLVTLPRAIAP